MLEESILIEAILQFCSPCLIDYCSNGNSIIYIERWYCCVSEIHVCICNTLVRYGVPVDTHASTTAWSLTDDKPHSHPQVTLALSPSLNSPHLVNQRHDLTSPSSTPLPAPDILIPFLIQQQLSSSCESRPGRHQLTPASPLSAPLGPLQLHPPDRAALSSVPVNFFETEAVVFDRELAITVYTFHISSVSASS